MAQTKTVPKRATMVMPTPNKKTLSSQKKIPVAKTPATPTKAAAQSVPKKTPAKTPAKVSPKTAAKKPTPNSVPKPT